MKTEKNSSYKPSSSIFLIVVVCFILTFSTQVSGFDWNDNITSYYKLDNNVLTDIVSSNNLTNSGTTNSSGILIDGRNYDGSGNSLYGTSGVQTGDYSANVWFKSTTQPGSEGRLLCINGDTGKGNCIATSASYSSDIRLLQEGIAWDTSGVLGLFDNAWHMATLVWDGTNTQMYIDTIWKENMTGQGTVGTKTGIGYNVGYTNAWNGDIDEVGIFNKILTPDEIIELYNSSDALPYSGGGLIKLISPVNDSTISDIGANFTVSGDVIGDYNVTNVTYFIWNNDSSIHNQTTISLSPNRTFNESLFIDEFVLGNYIWNAEICYENSSFNNCTFAQNNFTFNVVPFGVLNEEFSPNVLEGDTSNFNINISVITFERLTNVLFVYNGTSYPTTFTEYDDDEWFATINKNIQQVNGTEVVPFYWSVSLESGFIQNSTTQNQTIFEISIDDCSVFTNQIFNFTIVDETTQLQIDGVTENSSIKLDMRFSFPDNSEEIIQFSKEYSKINPARVCMNNSVGNSTLRMDAVIEYTAIDKFVEFYNVQNFIFDNSTRSQNITLYNLAESEGQEFKITYKGQDFIPVSDLIVQVQRKYIEEGVFKTIEIPMSGTNGFTIAHLVPNDVIYNLFFIKDGELLDSFTEVIANCQNPLITSCEINLNALITGTDLFDIITESDFFSSLTYDKDTRVVSSTFGIISGVSNIVQLNVTLIDNFGNTSVCSDLLNAAGGTLLCTIPESFGNSTIYATIALNGDIRREGYILLKDNPKDQYGGVLIFSSIVLLLLMFGMGVSYNPLITGIFLILGAFLLIGLNLAYSTSIVGAGATILWFVVAVVVVIIKGSGKR